MSKGSRDFWVQAGGKEKSRDGHRERSLPALLLLQVFRGLLLLAASGALSLWFLRPFVLTCSPSETQGGAAWERCWGLFSPSGFIVGWCQKVLPTGERSGDRNEVEKASLESCPMTGPQKAWEGQLLATGK